MSVLDGTTCYPFEITASDAGADYLGGIRIRAATSKEALERATEMDLRGMHHIRIIGPDGKSYAPVAEVDIDVHGGFLPWAPGVNDLQS